MKYLFLFHWKRDGRKILDKKFDGYVYSENSNEVYYKIYVREGDYNKDKDVPKPLLKKAEIVHKVDEVHEKPKEIKKRTTIKGRKKGEILTEEDFLKFLNKVGSSCVELLL